MADAMPVISAVLELVNYKRNLVFTPDDNLPVKLSEEDVRDILQALEDLNYKIIQTSAIVDNYRMQDANEVIAAWCPEGVEATDINAAQIFQHLASKGWLIVPPK